MKNNEIIHYGLVLFIVSFIAAAVMSTANMLTKDAIQAEIHKEFIQGLLTVLPEFNNDPSAEVLEIEGRDVYVARNDNEIVGYAVQMSSFKGYSGEIVVLVGADTGGTIYGVTVVNHTETPGLGDKITTGSFLALFRDSPLSKIYKVKADGGDIDQFSGATISPRAVCEAVTLACGTLQKIETK